MPRFSEINWGKLKRFDKVYWDYKTREFVVNPIEPYGLMFLKDISGDEGDAVQTEEDPED